MGSPRAVRILRDLIKSQSPDLICLSKNLVESSGIHSIAVKFVFDNVFVVDKVGRSGGMPVDT